MFTQNCLQPNVRFFISDLAENADGGIRQEVVSRLLFFDEVQTLLKSFRETSFYVSGLCLNQDVKTAYFLHNFCHLVEGGGSE